MNFLHTLLHTNKCTWSLCHPSGGLTLRDPQLHYKALIYSQLPKEILGLKLGGLWVLTQKLASSSHTGEKR